MKIGVLSDTHLQEGQFLPQFVWDSLNGVDVILHAGDSVVQEILVDLNCLAPVVAVRGNCDSWELHTLPDREITQCGGVRIGLIHGNAGNGRNTPDRAYQAFAKDSVDIIVFGHSHTPYSEWKGEILLFNPGSPTAKRRELHYSLGILEIVQGEVQAHHLYF
ncbi:MAG: metallophosphoesterase family protein [Desulfitobacteriaceae bacterium]